MGVLVRRGYGSGRKEAERRDGQKRKDETNLCGPEFSVAMH
jgi:hypothetical protein